MRVKLSGELVPRSLAGTILVDEIGFPRYWIHAWLVLYGSGLKESTRKKSIAAAERLYEAFNARLGHDCLDQLISDLDIETLISVLQGLFIQLRNEDRDRDIDNRQTWRYASSFVMRMLHHICLMDGIPKSRELSAATRRIDDEFKRLKTRPDESTVQVRALPSEVVEEILDIMSVHSPRNPFRTHRNKFRNYVLLILLLHLGLRRGELCLLAVDAIYRAIDPRTGVERYWMNVVEPPEDDPDPRKDRPSLKTAYSTRQIPIAKEIAALVARYIENYRGNPPHTFMFNSQQNRPIAKNSVNAVFSTITKCLSTASVNLLEKKLSESTVTPHQCRHTAFVVRLMDMLDAGVGQEDAMSRLKVFFGWSRKSDMPLHYGRAYFEDRLQEIWDRRFDAHVEHLRQLETSERPQC